MIIYNLVMTRFSLVGSLKSLFPIEITGYIGEKFLREIRSFANSLPKGSKVLDAGAGEMQHKPLFKHCEYFSADIAYEENKWNYRGIDFVVDLENMDSIPSNHFDAVLCAQVLEHVKHPPRLLKELYRVLKPGGRLLLTTNPAFEDHQQPHHYFNTTQFGIRLLFDEAEFTSTRVEYVGGYFVFLATILQNFWFYFGESYLIKLVDVITYPIYFLMASVLVFLDRFDKKRTLSSIVVGEAIKAHH